MEPVTWRLRKQVVRVKVSGAGCFSLFAMRCSYTSLTRLPVLNRPAGNVALITGCKTGKHPVAPPWHDGLWSCRLLLPHTCTGSSHHIMDAGENLLRWPTCELCKAGSPLPHQPHSHHPHPPVRRKQPGNRHGAANLLQKASSSPEKKTPNRQQKAFVAG